MKAFASQVCFGVCLLLLGCDSDDAEAPASSSTDGAGGSSGGAGGEAGSGAGDCESPPADNEIDVAGAYRDGYDGTHRIDDGVWEMGGSSFHLLEFSNAKRWAIAENAADNAYNPELFSRFEWTRENGQLFYCQSVYAASTAAEARGATRADAGDLVAGCGGFPWSSLAPIALVGSYRDDFGGLHSISPSFWRSGSSVFHLLEFSNDEHWTVTQNDCENIYFSGKYSRYDWLTVPGGEGGAAGAAGAGGAGVDEESTYYCQTGYDLDSAEAARELEPADPADLAEGCNGFPWSKLSAEGL